MNKRNETIKYICYIVVMYVLVFQNYLQKYIPILNHFDEFLAAITIPIFLIKVGITKQLKVKKYNITIVVLLSIMFFVGIYSIFVYKYQSISVAIYDIIAIYKFFLVYFLANIINNNKSIENFKNRFKIHIKIITIIFFVLTILNYIFNTFEASAIRYGLKINKLFYVHPSYLAAVCVFLLCMLVMFDEKVNTKYTYMLLFLILSTLRMKAIAFVVAFIAVSIYVCANNKKITFSKIGIVAIICFFVAFEQIDYYFISTEYGARKMLLTTSFEIAKDYFPIGTGFGTYGSYISGVSYSPIYYLYGLSKIGGLVNGKATFISDNFWPMILGQFGYIGAIAYALCILIILKKIQINFNIENKYKYIAQLSSLVYLLISSTSESAFVNAIAIPLSLIIGL